MSYQNRTDDFANDIDYKKPDHLRSYLDDEYKIRPRRQTKLSSPEQRRLTTEIKRARFLGLLPYTKDQTR
ncbi:MAG: 30S ribosomal protein S18 [bacterium]